jgi:SAM-dependent methyltransferase
MATESGYFAADAGAQQELDRLRLIEFLSDPTTTRHLEALGVAAGWQCLEAGAGAGSIARWLSERVGADGNVVAADIDVRFLGWLSEPNVEVRTYDVTKDALETDHFDLVHCRGLLCHVANPEAVLDRLIRALKPGGWILAEEPDFGIIEAADKRHPLAGDFDSASPKRFVFLREAGIMDGFFGRVLPALMEAAGLVGVDNEGSTAITRGGDAASRNWMSVCDRLDGYLETQGVLSTDEVAASRSAFEDPTFHYINCLIFQVWGQRPS